MNGLDLLIGYTPWTSDRTWAIVLGLLAAIVSLALLFVSWTRWGQTKSLTKCVALAVLAHVWLLMYAYGTRVMMPGDGGGGGGGSTIQVQFVNEDNQVSPTENGAQEADSSLIADTKPSQPLTLPELLPAPEPIVEKLPEAPNAPPLVTQVDPVLPSQNNLSNDVAPRPALEEGPTKPIANEASSIANHEMKLPTEPIVPKDQVRVPEPFTPKQVARVDQTPMPESYQNRTLNRAQAAGTYGGDANTEAAVEAALAWLARSQSPDGHWDAATYGAGRETKTLGLDREKTGGKADTGMTGLALLAFQGAGYSHLQGNYAETVRNGLGYLLSEQMHSGDLAGNKQTGSDKGVAYARMYCHGIAAFALAEAYAMTGDRRLEDGVRRAAEYTRACQNRRTGGWRYLVKDRDNDPGDMSQFGWQAMALQSARSGGIDLPRETDTSFRTFLDSVASGEQGGLATYRPRSVPGQKPSAAMTAEAMACRSLLRIPLSPGAEQEARRMLLSNLPGQGEENFYYWYYGTLAMFQLQDHDWQVWNEAMKKRLVSTQRMDAGNEIGSWDPNCIWGGYGGRVYSTALGCMCLEVYYRYLPIYRSNQTARSPGNWNAEWTKSR